MTIPEAKQHLTARLHALHIPFHKITAKTVSFADLARGGALFLTVHGAVFPTKPYPTHTVNTSPKPSEGGYIIHWANVSFKT